MIEIDRSKCKKMLVSSNGVDWDERIALFECTGGWCICVSKDYELNFNVGGTFKTVSYRYFKPLPEPKPMTSLDAMWWVTKKESKGHVIVNKHKESKEFDNVMPEFDSIDSIYEEYEWNELIRENGETKLKYSEWKPFNFDECDMGEG